jgi:hypothetical protein
MKCSQNLRNCNFFIIYQLTTFKALKNLEEIISRRAINQN